MFDYARVNIVVFWNSIFFKIIIEEIIKLSHDHIAL